MMRNISDDLNNINEHIQQCSDTNLSAQQKIFVNHIQRTTHNLLITFQHLPHSRDAHYHILPTFGDDLIQQVISIYGYAKLLLESPESFDGRIISDAQRPILEFIYDTGRDLQTYIENVIQQAHQYRRKARQHPVQSIDLITTLQNNLPIYTFWASQYKTDIRLEVDTQTATIQAQPYHFSALIEHIFTTVARDLVTQSTAITLYIKTNQTQVQLWIDVDHISFTDDHLRTLFQKDGRHIYLNQLQAMNTKVTIHPQSLSTLVLVFPQVAL